MMFALVAGIALGLTTPTTTGVPASDTVVRIGRGTTITVTSITKAVKLVGVDGDRVTVSGASLNQGGSEVGITESLLNDSRSDDVITVSVPVWARVGIESVQGNVTVRNAPAALRVGVVDGAIDVRGGSGRMTLGGTGSISVRDFGGERLSIQGVAGDIEVERAAGAIDIRTVAGDVTLSGLSGNEVRVESTNGDISWIGGFRRDGHYRFVTHAGDVELALPTGIDALLQVETFAGSFSSAISAATSGDNDDAVERRIVARYGNGSAQVRIESFNGDVRVVRARK